MTLKDTRVNLWLYTHAHTRVYPHVHVHIYEHLHVHTHTKGMGRSHFLFCAKTSVFSCLPTVELLVWGLRTPGLTQVASASLALGVD